MIATRRRAISPSGRVMACHGDPWGRERSQQMLDRSSPGHLIHGLLSHAARRLVARRLARGRRLLLATLVEGGWELLENSSLVTERHRSAAASRDDLGDSVLNSGMDATCMMAGVWLARRRPVWAAVLAIVGPEALTIRGSATGSRSTCRCCSGPSGPCGTGRRAVIPPA